MQKIRINMSVYVAPFSYGLYVGCLRSLFTLIVRFVLKDIVLGNSISWTGSYSHAYIRYDNTCIFSPTVPL